MPHPPHGQADTPTELIEFPVAMRLADIKRYFRLTGYTAFEQDGAYFPQALNVFINVMRCWSHCVDVRLNGNPLLRNAYRRLGIHPRVEFYDFDNVVQYCHKTVVMPKLSDTLADEVREYANELGLRCVHDIGLTAMTFFLDVWEEGRANQAHLYGWFPSAADLRKPLPKRIQAKLGWNCGNKHENVAIQAQTDHSEAVSLLVPLMDTLPSDRPHVLMYCR